MKTRELLHYIKIYYKGVAKYIYSFLLVIFPLLTIYTCPIPKLTLGEFLLVLFVLLTLIFDFKHYRLSKVLIPFTLAVVINLYFMVLTKYSPELVDDLGTGARLLFDLMILMIFAYDYFDYKIALKILIYVAAFLSLYGLVQLAFSLKKIYLYNFIPLLPQFSGNLGSCYDSIVANYKQQPQFFRMLSLFREPAHFATYLLLPSVLLLLKKDRTIWSTTISLFFLSVAVATLSSTGVIISIIILAAYVVFLFLDKRIKWWQIVIILTVIAGGIFAFVYFGGWNYFIEKTFGKDKSIVGIFNDTRMTVMPMFFKTDILHAIFGRGLASHGYYAATYVHTIYSLGILGLIGLITTYGLLYNKMTTRSMVALLIAFAILNVGTEVVYGAFGVPYLAFLITNSEERIVLLNKYKIRFEV